jgi:hypothetical protein
VTTAQPSLNPAQRKAWFFWLVVCACGLLSFAAIGDRLLSDPECERHVGDFDNSSFNSDFDTSGLECPVTRSADSPTYRVRIPGT